MSEYPSIPMFTINDEIYYKLQSVIDAFAAIANKFPMFNDYIKGINFLFGRIIYVCPYNDEYFEENNIKEKFIAAALVCPKVEDYVDEIKIKTVYLKELGLFVHGQELKSCLLTLKDSYKEYVVETIKQKLDSEEDLILENFSTKDQAIKTAVSFGKEVENFTELLIKGLVANNNNSITKELNIKSTEFTKEFKELEKEAQAKFKNRAKKDVLPVPTKFKDNYKLN